MKLKKIEKILSSDHALMLEKLPKKAVILGAGAIGAEFSHIWNGFGVEVHLVELLDQVLPLEDSEIAVITKNKVEIIDNEKNVIEREIYEVTWDVAAAEKDGYEHFMLKEIFEQPKVVRETLVPRLPMDKDEVVLDGISLSKKDLDKINKIITFYGLPYLISAKYIPNTYSVIETLCT